MLNINEIAITSKNNITIDNIFFKNEPLSDTLVVVFPGKGYNGTMPLLYYCTEAALQLGCDVISLKYFFQCTKTDFEDKDYSQVIGDCYKSLNDNILAINSYKNIIFVSKSLGTVFAGEVALLFEEMNIYQFFLTPLSKTIPHIEKSACTVIVGDNDGFFPKNNIEKLCNFTLPTTHVISKANHSLEIEGDCIQSLAILSDITKVWIKFMKSIKTP